MKNINCGNCGAGLYQKTDSLLMICSYCESILIFNNPNSFDQNGSDQLDSPIHHRIMLPELKYKANLNRSTFNSQGGNLYISDEEIFFKPHRFNFGDLDSNYMKINEISSLEIQGILFFSSLVISDVNGKIMELVTWNNKVIISEINKRMNL